MTGHATRRQAWLRLGLGLGWVVGGLAGSALAGPAVANSTGLVPAEVAAALPGARLQGQSRLRFMGLSVYDARLWAGGQFLGADWSAAPIALELEYRRSLKGAQIAERSLVEMRKLADVAATDAERWLAAMKASFPDVRDGDRITGVSLPGQGARFFVNGSLKGEIADAEFARLFFGIWLSPRTSEPAMRDALLGGPTGNPR